MSRPRDVAQFLNQRRKAQRERAALRAEQQAPVAARAEAQPGGPICPPLHCLAAVCAGRSLSFNIVGCIASSATVRACAGARQGRAPSSSSAVADQPAQALLRRFLGELAAEAVAASEQIGARQRQRAPAEHRSRSPMYVPVPGNEQNDLAAETEAPEEAEEATAQAPKW